MAADQNAKALIDDCIEVSRFTEVLIALADILSVWRDIYKSRRP
jgi:hypothetical protein